MSYEQVQPDYYKFRQPNTPWHAGTTGWSHAPVPMWGNNPNQRATPRIAVNGCATCGLGFADPAYLKMGAAAVGLGAVTWYFIIRKPKRMRSNRRRQRARR